MRGDDRVSPRVDIAVTVFHQNGHADVHYGPIQDPMRNIPVNVVQRAARIVAADGRVLLDRT